MTRKSQDAWKWYASFKTNEDLNLPPITVEKETPTFNLNGLRHHYALKHPEINLTTPGTKGVGRYTLEDEQAAVNFYKAIHNDHLAKAGDTSAVPIKIEDTSSDESLVKGEDLDLE